VRVERVVSSRSGRESWTAIGATGGRCHGGELSRAARLAEDVREASFDSRRRDAVPLTQMQLVTAVAERADLSKSEAKRSLTALEDVVLEELGNAQKVRIGGLVQLAVGVKPAQKARAGRNPATGEEIKIAAKPASVALRARPLARAKEALPSVQKARRRLAA
jgi:DNA-binding protein HU-beta